ncbi:polymeric immunoglobulin receptor-like isoform X1 [Pimephales promelas]|uniref:polymeric immunoglobulin receptor-like isoform X1 n=1 Tax=Pimephales promelas TaxID=90988 RepID=UPI0019558F5F|nr:polymeric immunoglobulin receptor-like isoform X1 [Pimephales promelas]
MMKTETGETLQLFVPPTVSLMKFIVFFLWLITGPAGSASRELTVQTGGSVVIPCYYDRKYTEHRKYWCFHANSVYVYCTILAYANETKGRVSVMDHPDQSFFTVTMRNLQREDTGSYWCAEEIGGKLQRDETEKLHLKVQSAPDVSVMNSSVSGREGDNVSVQCFYTSGYQDKPKQWCRYKDQSCYTVGRTDTSQNSSVQISDDGRSSFTVLMTGLRLNDSGWYFCSAGNLQVSVHLTVTAVVTTDEFDKNGNSNTTSISKEQQNKHYGYLEVWIPAVVLFLLLVTVVGLSAVKLRKKNNINNTQTTEVNRDGDSDAGNGVCSSPAVAENDVTYSSVTIRPKTKAFSLVSAEDEVTYSSVHKQ